VRAHDAAHTLRRRLSHLPRSCAPSQILEGEEAPPQHNPTRPMTQPTGRRNNLSANGREGGVPRSRRPLRVLLVDDDLLLARLLKANLAQPGRIQVECVGSGEEALARLEHGPVDALITDLSMPGLGGIELVRRVREQDESLPIIVITAFGTIEVAVDAIRAGANEFLQKPVNVDAILALIERAVTERPLRQELSAARARRTGASVADYLCGDFQALDKVRKFAERLARTPHARVLITGESGTGKSLLARAIHDLSDVSGRFVQVNCAAIPATLLETELFGHEKGAFTDAKATKRGLIESAEHGTLFLDEVGAMPLDLQAKLLLFLESREIRRVGGVHPIAVQTRVIAATNDDLRARVRDRAFREDLLYRLDVASIAMPPLRMMPGVIPTLAERFVRDLCRDLGRPVPEMTERSFALLLGYSWPGNARELRNAVERALIFLDGPILEVHPPAIAADSSTDPAEVVLKPGLTLDEVERRYIGAVLANGAGALHEIASLLGISRKTLWEKRRRHGL
jgi:two-component system, NtrC family, response regulator AtoC